MRAAIVVVVIALLGGTAAAGKPADFASDAQLFYRIVACAGDAPVDAELTKVVDAHCKWMKRRTAAFRKKFVDPAARFFADKRPAGLPTTVVYPFGGGDLATALVTYPEATEVTTLSLEHAGDPTRLKELDARQLKKWLKHFRNAIHGLLTYTVSESENLRKVEKGPIPGQLGFFIVGAAVLGYEPVGLRYFKLADDGSVVYYTAEEIDGLADDKARRKQKGWTDTDWSVAYANVELSLRKAGDASAPVIVHRHLAANLDNEHFRGSWVEKHLLAKGTVSMIVKSASYLIWRKEFSDVRDYVAGHLAFLASDSTGLLPDFAKSAGLVQETYGRFVGARLPMGKSNQKPMAKLWKSQAYRKLPFRYGYRDVRGNSHLILTWPKKSTP